MDGRPLLVPSLHTLQPVLLRGPGTRFWTPHALPPHHHPPPHPHTHPFAPSFFSPRLASLLSTHNSRPGPHSKLVLVGTLAAGRARNRVHSASPPPPPPKPTSLVQGRRHSQMARARQGPRVFCDSQMAIACGTWAALDRTNRRPSCHGSIKRCLVAAKLCSVPASCGYDQYYHRIMTCG